MASFLIWVVSRHMIMQLKNELAKEFSGSYDGGEVYNSSFDMPGDFAADSYEKSDAYDGASPEEKFSKSRTINKCTFYGKCTVF